MKFPHYPCSEMVHFFTCIPPTLLGVGSSRFESSLSLFSVLPGTSPLTSPDHKHLISRNVIVTAVWQGSYDMIGDIYQNTEPVPLDLFPEDQRNRPTNKAIRITQEIKISTAFRSNAQVYRYVRYS